MKVKMSKKLEKDLDIFDIWRSPNGNMFIKISETHSLSIGNKKNLSIPIEKGNRGYIESDNVTPVKKIGRLVFDK